MSSAPIRLQMDALDFDLLTGGPMDWQTSTYLKESEPGDLINYTAEGMPEDTPQARPWKWAYMFSPSEYISIVAAKSWLAATGWAYEVFFHEPTEIFLLLTHYKSEGE